MHGALTNSAKAMLAASHQPRFQIANTGVIAATVQCVRSARSDSAANRSSDRRRSPAGSRDFGRPPNHVPASGRWSFHARTPSRRAYQRPPCSNGRKRVTGPGRKAPTGRRAWYQPAATHHVPHTTTSTTSAIGTSPHSHGEAGDGTGTVDGVKGLALLAIGFIAMEPVTYATHRWLMHGPGAGLHRSHHVPRPGSRWQANDLFPAAFSLLVMGAMAVGFNVAGWSWLVPLTIGVTLYGVAYALVHDVYAHRRAPLLRRRRVSLDRLATAHALHHRSGGEPYGMLLPFVPRRLRLPGGQLPPRQIGQDSSGSTPSHVPLEP
jgi:beta-carotene 3-hydroxylase